VELEAQPALEIALGRQDVANLHIVSVDRHYIAVVFYLDAVVGHFRD